jgi:hypothetical protein
MSEGHKQKPKFVPAERVTLRGRDGSPPSWAVGVMAAVIGFVVLMFLMGRGGDGILYSIVPFARSDYFWIGLIFLPMVALIVVAAASKGLDFQRAQSWPTARGKIVRSELIAKHHRFAGEPETVENAPAVEYEFSADVGHYRGSRIGIGDDSGGANSEATLARYPLGAEVTVYYDPNDPKNCVLERDGPFHASATAQGATAAAPQRISAARVVLALVQAALLIGAIWWLFARGPDFITAHFPKADAEVAIFAACFGLLALLLFVAAHHHSKVAQQWPKAAGTVVKSEVESFRETTSGRTTTMYRPAVEFSYEVRGRSYRSNQIKLGMTASGTQDYAEKVATKYLAGSAVEVHYDPDNPGDGALENPTGATWIVAALAAAAFAISISQLGIFR